MIDDLISICKNWRCQVLLVLTIAVIVLVFAESDSFLHLFAIKVAAFLFGYIILRLYRKWNSEGKLNELTKFSEEV
jgi:hypothetical protein